MLVNDQVIPAPVPESIRLFIMCEAMEWNHLPVAGGWYDQSPQLVEDFETIFACRAAKQRADKNKPTPR